MIAVSVKVFRGQAETIIRENSSLLQDASITLRLSFPDVVFPGDLRNEMYIKLWSADFSPSGNTQARRSVANFARGAVSSTHNSIHVTMEVRDQDGKSVPPILSAGSGEPPATHFHSMVFQRNNQPTFGELVKLSLPLGGITRWHVFFTFRNRGRDKPLRGSSDSSDRPFAFAFVPLFPDGRAALEDGPHTLLLYRADRLHQITPDMYLGAPSWVPPGQKPDQIFIPPELQRIAPVMRDTLTIRNSLCSTKYTQNPVLLSLLYWEHITDEEELTTILSKFTFVGEVEIVKFLGDIFNSLFGIMVSKHNRSGEIDLLVFNALVTVLRIVQDRRFNNFQPVLDVYIENHFNCPIASSHMMRSMNLLMANPTSPDTASSLRAALTVWDYIYKFITRSRELQKVKELGIAGGVTAEHLESSFRRELRAHLGEINRMLSTTTPASIIGTQTMALQNFTSILPELAKIFPVTELVSHVRAFANAIVIGKGKIVVWKLIMFLQVVRGFLFDTPNSRSLLLEAVVIWIKPHFGRFDEYVQTNPGDSEATKDAARINWLENIRLCVTIIAVMLDKLCTSLVQPTTLADKGLLRKEQDNVDYLLSLLPRFVINTFFCRIATHAYIQAG
jgi:dedicator of cytokinesis protein 3